MSASRSTAATMVGATEASSSKWSDCSARRFRVAALPLRLRRSMRSVSVSTLRSRRRREAWRRSALRSTIPSAMSLAAIDELLLSLDPDGSDRLEAGLDASDGVVGFLERLGLIGGQGARLGQRHDCVVGFL